MSKKEIFLTIEQVLREGNNIVNQDIKSQFVHKHVNCNVNQMVEYILRKSWEDHDAPMNFDDIENYYSYPEFIGEYAKFDGGNDKERQLEIDRIQEISNDLLNSKGQKLQKHRNIHELIEEEVYKLQTLEEENAEIFEWWQVSDFLCVKLKEQGYPVIEDFNLWGRTTTGQAILLDGVITKICADMEILQGQKHSWQSKF